MQYCRYKTAYRGIKSGGSPEGSYCICADFPRQQQLLCKMTYDEARAILYGDNKFAMRAHAPGDLEILYSLLFLALFELRYLLILPNYWLYLCGNEWFLFAPS